MFNSYEEEVKQRKVAEKSAKREEEEKVRAKVAFKSVLASHEGRSVLKQIIKYCDPEMNCYSLNPIDTAFNEGIRTVGKQIKSLIIEANGKASYRQVEDEVI